MTSGHTIAEVLSELSAGGLSLLPEAEYICAKHGPYNGRAVKSVSFGTISHSCPLCKLEAEKAELRLWQKQSQLRKMNISAEHKDAGFDNFKAHIPELQEHLLTAKHFACKPEGKLIMLGSNGTGKTHLAVAVLKEVGNGVIHTVFQVSAMLKKSYNENDGDSEYEILDRLAKVKLLVLDEIGRTKASDWEMNWLSFLLNDRHENNRPTILITNRHFPHKCPEGERGCPHCLSNYLDKDIISRIIGDGIPMNFSSAIPDYRIRKGHEFRANFAQERAEINKEN